MIENIAAGSLSGVLATLPMTFTMRSLGMTQREDTEATLPPREISSELTAMAGVKPGLSEAEKSSFALVSHYGYGGAAGAVYETVTHSWKLSPLKKGVAFGLAVWAGSYLVWLPALGLQPPPQQRSLKRNLTMIAAHIVWGAALGLASNSLQKFADRKVGRPVNSDDISARI